MLILSSDQIDIAAELLKRGELVAFPTETVYGLGALLQDTGAIAKIFEAKGRPADNPLIAHLAELAQVEQIAREIPPIFYHLAEVFFPGPLTVVLKKHPSVPPVVCGGLDTIALRMPSHPVAHALIKAVGGPLAAPSANLSGKPSSTSASHVAADFEGKISAVIDGGKTQYGIESTVVHLAAEEPCLLRTGVIPKEEIERVLGNPLRLASAEDRLASPGTRYRHYAPQARLILFQQKSELEEYLHSASESPRLLLSTQKEEGFEYLTSATLYALLRRADDEGYSEIVVSCDPKAIQDIALMDRLNKASTIQQ